MQFAVFYTYRAASEATIKRLNQLFGRWQPPKDYEIKAHYVFADGTGGLTLVKTGSEAAMYAAIIPWGAFVEFRVTPLLEIDKAFAITEASIAWRESITS